MAFAAGGQAFDISGPGIGKNAALLDAELDIGLSSALSLSFRYEGALGRDMHDHSAKAGLSFRF